MPGDVADNGASSFDTNGQLRRAELLKQFAAAGRIVVLNAEQGAGKTELLSQWLGTQSERHIAWIALDEGAAEPRSFWLRVLQALTAARPETFSGLTNDYMSGRIPPQEALSLVISATMRDPFPITLAIDDLHFIGAELQDQLVSLLRRSPHLQLFATSRSTTRFEVPLTAAGLDVTVLGSHDLAFSATELAAVTGSLPYRLTDSEITALRRATRGHPLAVRLALSVMQQRSRGGTRRPSTDEVASGVEDLLADFAPTFESGAATDLALASALSPEVDERLAEQLGGAAAWSWFERFDQAGIGRIALVAGRKTFRLHTLMSTALRPRALREFPEDRVAEIRRLAFEQLYELSDPIEILELLIDGQMDRAIFPHFVRNYSEISGRRTQELITIAETITPERMSREGTIPIMIAVALSETATIPTPRIRELLQIGMPTLASRAADVQGAAGRLLLLARFAGLRVNREYAEAAEVGEEFLRLGPMGSASWRSGMFAARMQVIVTEILAGRIPAAIELAAESSDDAHSGRRAHLHAVLAFAHGRLGDLRAAKRELSSIDSTRPGWQGSLQSIGWHLATAMRAASLGRHEAASDALQPVIDRLDEFELWPAIVWTRGVTRLMADQAARGLHEFDAALAQRQHFPISDGWAEQLQSLRGEFLLATGDLIRARAALTHDGDDTATLLARTRLALLSSQPNEALAQLEAIDESELFPSQAVQHQLLRAATHARLGNTEFATTLATQALLALDRLDNRLPLSWLPAGDIAVLRSLVPTDIWRQPPGTPFAGDEVMLEELSKREALVLVELARGGSIDDIAGDLHVSSNTIKTQTRSIYRKLKVSSRTEALARARQMGLV